MTTVQRRWLIAILLVGLAVRVGWAVAQPRTAAAIDKLPDQREYLTLAEHLRHDGQLRLFDARFGQTVWAYRLPGYPALIAAAGGSVLALRLAQAVLDTATVLGVFVLGRRWGGDGVGVVAATAVAVNPIYVYFSGLVLTETPFAAAVVWATVALTGRRTLMAAVCFAVAVYLRPTAVVLGPALAAVAGWAAPNRGGRRAYQPVAVVMVALGLALIPWAWRNHGRLGTAVWTTTNDGITFFDGFHDGATGASDQRFVEQLPALRSMTEVDRSRFLTRQARAWAVGHPAAVARLAVAKVLRGWSPVPLSDQFGRPAYRWVGGTYAVLFDGLCLVGLWAPRVPWPGKLLLVTPAVVVTAVQVMTVGSIRYRMPAEAPLAVLAGAGAVELWERRRSHAPAGLHTAPPV